jgi:hypothetical protein
MFKNTNTFMKNTIDSLQLIFDNPNNILITTDRELLDTCIKRLTLVNNNPLQDFPKLKDINYLLFRLEKENCLDYIKLNYTDKGFEDGKKSDNFNDEIEKFLISVLSKHHNNNPFIKILHIDSFMNRFQGIFYHEKTKKEYKFETDIFAPYIESGLIQQFKILAQHDWKFFTIKFNNDNVKNLSNHI